jgi:protein TonB
VSRKQRMVGLSLAILFEALVVLVLLTLGTRRTAELREEGKPLSTFDLASPEPEAVPEAEQVKREVAEIAEQQPETVPPVPPQPSLQPPAPTPPTAAQPTPQPAPLVKVAPSDLATADLRTVPSTGKPAATYGPPAPSSAPDTPLVDGSGPNGERLYAAAWQREPSDGELRGYLSTAQPGWALIACRTVPDFRVDDCVAVGEHPRGSQMARAVLAAAWQFRVRPPRIGGRLQVGEWVRIRIEYGVTRRNAWERDRG